MSDKSFDLFHLKFYTRVDSLKLEPIILSELNLVHPFLKLAE